MDFVEVLVNGWPHVFLLTTEEVQGGQEFLGDYGDTYWEKMEVQPTA